MTVEPTGNEPEPINDPEPDPAPNGEPPAWAAEKEKLLREHNSANKRARELSKKVDSLETQLNEHKKKGTEGEGDPVKLREAFATRETELNTQISTLKGQLHERDKRAAFDRNAHLFAEGAREDAWELVKGKLEIEEGDDGIKIVVDGDYRSVDEFFKDLADKKPHLAANKAKGGTGSNGAEKGGQKATSIPNDFGSWSIDRKKEWMLANPTLAAEAASKALGG